MKTFTRELPFFAFLLCVTLLPELSQALINIRFTPAHLINEADQILLLDVRRPEGDQLAVRLLETLKGSAPLSATWTIRLDGLTDQARENLETAFQDTDTVQGLWFRGDFSAASTGQSDSDSAPSGVLEIGIHWFALHQINEIWYLFEDPFDMNAVWGGSANMLASAVRQTLKDAGLDFPAAVRLRWRGANKLLHLDGQVFGILAADLFNEGSLTLIVCSDSGDRILQRGGRGCPPIERTEAVRLSSRSLKAAIGDFNRDGRLDLASWDGKELRLFAQSADRSFAPVGDGVELADCRWMTVWGHDLVVLTGQKPRKFSWNNGWMEIPWNAEASDGMVADAKGDGVLRWWPLRAASAKAALDTDADGVLEFFTEAGVFSPEGLNRLAETGEWDYHGMREAASLVHLCVVDLNLDGRPGIAAFYRNRPPMLFFNRGFNTFGYARALDRSQLDMAAAEALSAGTPCGLVRDLDGDGIPDLLAATHDGGVWVLWGEMEASMPPLGVELFLSAEAATPLTIKVDTDRRPLGAWYISHGDNGLLVGIPEPGPVTLEWRGPGDTKRRHEIIVESGCVRVTIPPKEQ